MEYSRAALAGDGRVLVIDVRPKEEYADGHVPGAQNMRPDRFRLGSKPDPRISRFSTVVVYGEHPGSVAARTVTKRMIEIGYDNVYWYPGGWEEWTAAGLGANAARSKPAEAGEKPAGGEVVEPVK